MAEELKTDDLQSSISQLTDIISQLVPVLTEMKDSAKAASSATDKLKKASKDQTDETKFLKDKLGIARSEYSKQADEVKSLNKATRYQRDTLIGIYLLGREELKKANLKIAVINAELSLAQESLKIKQRDIEYIKQNLAETKASIVQKRQERAVIDALVEENKKAIEATKSQIKIATEAADQERVVLNERIDALTQHGNSIRAEIESEKVALEAVNQRAEAEKDHRKSLLAEIDATTASIDSIKQQKDSINEEISNSVAQKAAASQRIDRLLYLNESYTSEISLLDQALTQTRAKYKRGEKMSEVDQSLIAEYESMRSSAESRRSANEQSIDSELAYKKSLNEGIESSSYAQFHLNAEQLALESQLKTFSSALEQSTDAVASAELDFFDLSGSISTMENLLDQVSDELLETNLELDDLAHGINSHVQDLENLVRSQKGLEEEYDKYTSEISELQQAAGAQTQAITQANKAIEENKEAIDELNKKLKTAQIEKLFVLADTASRFSKKIEQYANSLGKLVEEVRKTQQQFGIAAGQAVNLKIDNFLASVSSYMGSLMSGFSRAGATAQEIQTAQADFQAEFGGVLTSKAAGDLAAQAKEMGVTTAQLAQARRVFMTQTKGNMGDAASAQSKFIGEFQKKGLTSKDAMLAIAQNSELLARNGTRFATSFVRAAADAKKIGVDLSKVDQVGDSIIGDFEGFLEKQAELGAMGFNFDSNKIAQVAETGDTGALFNELRSQLAATGKDITKLRRSEQLALSGAFGIPMAELQRMAGPTDGSGEELTDQEKTNSLLDKLVNGLEFASKFLGAISAILSGVHSVLLLAIAKNTGGFGKTFADIKNLFGGIKGMFGGGGSTGIPKTGPRAPSPAGSPVQKLLGGATAPSQKLLGGATPPPTGPAQKLLGGATPPKGGTPPMTQNIGDAVMGKDGVYKVNPTGGMSGAAGKAMGGAKMGAGMGALGGIMSGISEYQESGSIKKAFGRGLANMAGSIIGGALGSFIPIPGVGTMLGAAAGGWAADWLVDKVFADDMTSKAGYGQRTLVTPTQTIALNNQDNIVSYADDMISQGAGIDLLSKGSIAENATAAANQPITVDMSKLEAKLDQIVDRLAGMGVYMDGAKVGKMLYNSNDKQSVGMMRQQALQSV